ncbi:MAG: transglutaminase family protein [Deltaproteobacteria bacterium]|nr:transglutaminase family protein [Deltaproteobacteria bacterium]
MDPYLASTYFIDFEHPAVKNMLAHCLVDDELAEREKAVRLFYAVRDGIRYNPRVEAFIRDTNKVSRVIAYGEGFCVQKALVLIALARSVSIPARLGLADIVNHLITGELIDAMGTNIFTCHGYVELYLDGKWIKATPTFDAGMCQKKGLQDVEFDGKHDAVLPERDLAGNRHIEYLQYFGTYADMPFEFIMEKWQEHYPNLKSYIADQLNSRTA